MDTFLGLQIIQFVEFVGKEGLVLHQEEFVKIINFDLESEYVYVRKRSLNERYAQAQVILLCFLSSRTLWVEVGRS